MHERLPRQLALFGLLLVTYAYFFQGGGWNQNSRLDQTRALVEEGRFSINGYLVYERSSAQGATLARVALPTPLARRPPLGRLNSGDVAKYAGRLYPNKPPGLSLLAVPGYALAHAVAATVGADPDDWWPQTLAAHATTALSVGLVCAAGVVLFLWISRQLFPALPMRAHVLAALSLGLATPFFPFATILFDHSLTACVLLAVFAAQLRSIQEPGRWVWAAVAGALAGLALVINYAAAPPLGLLFVYGVWKQRSWPHALAFATASLPFAIALLAYHAVCFGSPFVTAPEYSMGRWMLDEGRWLGVVGVPVPGVLVEILLKPYRGLFYSSPVLLLALLAWLKPDVRAGRTAELTLCLSIFAVALLTNSSFNGWHGGSTFAPRYLIPALPFVALPLAPLFARFPKGVASVAALSASLMLLATAVGPLVPKSVPAPFGSYLLPLAAGRSVQVGLSRIEGPVSVSRAGVYEGSAERVLGPGSPESHWNAFNLGELCGLQGAWSLLPLLCLWAAAGAFALRRSGSSQSGPHAPSSG